MAGVASLLGEIFTPAGLADRVEDDAAPYGAGPIPPPVPSPRQKLVLFTEHRDTLSYLQSRITTLLGHETAVVVIHGGMGGRIASRRKKRSGTIPRFRCCWRRMRREKASICSAPT